MTKNVGGVDRVVRIVAGLVLIVLAVTGQIGPWGWLGILILGTGILGFCGLYRLLGISTCQVREEKQNSEAGIQ